MVSSLCIVLVRVGRKIPALQVLNKCMHLSTINMELIHGQTIENKLMFSTVQADSL